MKPSKTESRTPNMSERVRVVVTGMGVISPLGLGVDATWQGMINGKSGVGLITSFDTSDYGCKVAAQVTEDFGQGDFIGHKDLKKMDRFIQMGMVAANEAMAQAGLSDVSPELGLRTGVCLGSGIGGLPMIEEACTTLAARGPKRISPFFIPAILINLLPGQVSMRWGLKGPNISPVTACATSAHALGEAAEMIRRGAADIMVAGGAESGISPLSVAGFAAARALTSGFNDNPQAASRPFDRDRDGFVIGEGAAILVLEREDHAKARGATILAELAGYGATGDAYHLTMPAPGGDGARRAMQAALDDAGIGADAIGYVNAHATSTPAGDEVESQAIEAVFGKKVPVSATKSMTGHLLGGAGALEAVASIQAMRTGILPPTINLDNVSEGCNLDYIPHTAREAKTAAVLSNSFGFGGTNAALVFKAV